MHSILCSIYIIQKLVKMNFTQFNAVLFFDFKMIWKMKEMLLINKVLVLE